MSHPKRQKLTKGSALFEGGTLEKYRKVTEELCRNASNEKAINLYADTIVRLNFFIPPIQSQWHPLRCVRPRRI